MANTLSIHHANNNLMH